MEEIRRISDEELDVSAGAQGNVTDMAVGVIIGGAFVFAADDLAAGTDRFAASAPAHVVTDKSPEGAPGGGAQIRVR